jgi:hypothetical protein
LRDRAKIEVELICYTDPVEAVLSDSKSDSNEGIAARDDNNNATGSQDSV